MKILGLAMQKVKNSTIVNCFVKAGVLKEQQKSAQLYGDDPLKDLPSKSNRKA